MGKSSNPFKSIKKSWDSVDGFFSHAADQYKQNMKNLGDKWNWTENRGTIIGTVAGLLTGGLGAGIGTMITAASVGASVGSKIDEKNIAKDKQEQYDAQVQKAEADALQKRKANLLSTKKQLSPRIGKSYVMGGAGGSEDILTTNKLG